MVICADTSFLFSVYGNDVHSERALKWLRKQNQPLHISSLNEFELGNALRFSLFKGYYKQADTDIFWQEYLSDRDAGRLKLLQINLAEVLKTASEISREFTMQYGHRSFDILHVSAAKVMSASHFLSFDQNQLSLAKRVNLTAPRL
jgi:predicted nucleic acid-binding protein